MKQKELGHLQNPKRESSSPCQNKTVMAMWELLKAEDQTKSQPISLNEEVSSYMATDSIYVEADPLKWWQENESNCSNYCTKCEIFLNFIEEVDL